jgi:hypothetical protein
MRNMSMFFRSRTYIKWLIFIVAGVLILWFATRSDLFIKILSDFIHKSLPPQLLGISALALLLAGIYSLNYITLCSGQGGGYTLNLFRTVTGAAGSEAFVDSARPAIIRQGIWLVSPFYDLTFITLSISLVLFPHITYMFMGKNILVDLTVTMLIGGPHMFATYTMTFMEPRFREKYPLYTWGALLLPPLIITLAILNLTLLVTIFFFWASIHVIHQVAYITDAYRMKDARGWTRISRFIDYGLLMTALYPIATQKLIKGDFITGGRILLFPEFLKQSWVPYPVWIAFLTFLTAFIVRSIWEARHGLFHAPKTLLISLSVIFFFFTPILKNLDVAFQGLNTWHSFQYLAIVLYLNRFRAQKGFIGSEVVQQVSRKGWKLYALCLGFTLLAGIAYFTVLTIVSKLGAFNTGGNFSMIFLGNVSQNQHFFAFYSVVLSCLLIHYYFDHFLFLQKDKIITPKWN